MFSEKEAKSGTAALPKDNRTILIVDDDEIILHLLRRFFIGEGFEVSVARDGSEAKEKLKTIQPDLVLTDIKMPSLSGDGLIRFIHQHTEGIPVIVMTAYPYLYPPRETASGVKAYFVKPFDLYEMFSSVERILGG